MLELKPDSNTSSMPLVVAVTGHRDLLLSELPGIRQRVRDLLDDLRVRYPNRRLRVMSALAEGADRLVAELAIECGVELSVILPMQRALYAVDFQSADSKREFDELCDRAMELMELPVAHGNSLEGLSTSETERSRQYAQLGVFLCAHCHILLAIWDGKYSPDLGGTSQVVKFHHDDTMPGYTPKTATTQQMLIDDESDLVYHIVCSRDRPDGAPQTGLLPLDSCWFTNDEHHPRSQEIPSQHRLIFERSGEFGFDAACYAEQIESGKYPLYSVDQGNELPVGVDEINRLFCNADWLAIYFQRKVLFTLRITHLLAFLMGFMFILYSDVETWTYYMVAFLFFFFASAVTQRIAGKREWHRKYLDYRTLAEGLRVQFYWAVAGIANENVSKFTHDNFLQNQDPELGWIRNVMRVAGTRYDANPAGDSKGLKFVMSEWIGDDHSGQLGYFATKLKDRLKRHRRTEILGQVSLMISVSVVLAFVMVGSYIAEAWISPLMAFMGTTLLLYAIRQGYAYATAEKDLIKQYEFMFRLFKNARRRLDSTDDPSEQRQILKAVGGSALDENAEWILLHRDRTIDQGEVWRMGS